MRTIATTYYSGKKTVKINHAAHPQTAVLHAVNHLQLNDYAATVVDIADTTTGELHAVITHSVNGRIAIVFKRDPKSPTCIVLEKS